MTERPPGARAPTPNRRGPACCVWRAARRGQPEWQQRDPSQGERWPTSAERSGAPLHSVRRGSVTGRKPPAVPPLEGAGRPARDRKSVVSGKRVELGGRRIII